MARNVEIFSYFVSMIFTELYDTFPVETRLEKDDFMRRFYRLVDTENLFDIVEDVTYCDYLAANSEGVSNEQKKICQKLSKQCELALEGKGCDKRKYENIFDSTVEFLTLEGYIRPLSQHGYQMTHKGFSHIHKPADDNSTIIQYFKANVSDPSKFLGSVSSDVMMSTISRFLLA